MMLGIVDDILGFIGMLDNDFLMFVIMRSISVAIHISHKVSYNQVPN